MSDIKLGCHVGMAGKDMFLASAREAASYGANVFKMCIRDRLIVAIALGLNFPMYLNLRVWHIIIFAYILIASVTPVWALLQPRDYLNSYLLIFMIVGAVIGVRCV